MGAGMRIPEYPWLNFVGMRVPVAGQIIIDTNGKVCRASGVGYNVRPIIEIDNAYNALDLCALKIPEGFEIDGASAAEAFGEIGQGGWYLSSRLHRAFQRMSESEFMRTTDSRRIRLRKIQPKTKTWVVLESCDPHVVEAWRKSASKQESDRYDGSPIPAGILAVRIEERPR